MNEEMIINSKDEREKLVRRVEVLEKVKKLLLIPGTEFATVKQVAEFYEVGEKAIQSLYYDHADELKEDGVVIKSIKDFLNLLEGNLKTEKGKTVFTLKDNTILQVPSRGLRIFPRRAILRVGMLLRDSEIAKEVRSQLLNIEEKTSNEVKIHDINTEEELLLNITLAYKSGNIDKLMDATTAYKNFQSRYIRELESKAIAYDEIMCSDSSVTTAITQKIKDTKATVNWTKIANKELNESAIQVLVYIHEYINESGISPTMRDICKGTGLKSTSSVYAHTEKLHSLGYITKDYDSPRSIRVNEDKYVKVIR